MGIKLDKKTIYALKSIQLDENQLLALSKITKAMAVGPTFKKITDYPPFLGTLSSNSLFYLVDNGADYNISYPEITSNIINTLGYVTVGNGAQYATINAAYVAGKYNMWVVGNVTETTTTTYTNSLHIQVNDGLTLAFNADVKLIAGNTTSSIAWNLLGKSTISFSLTSNGSFIDASAATSTGNYPAFNLGGAAIFINTSSTSVNVEPVTAPSAIIDIITYVTDGGINSYFNFVNCKLGKFELSPKTAINDCYGFKITGFGSVGSVELNSDCSNSSVLFSVNDCTVGNVTCDNSNGVPTCYLINSSCDNAHGINQAIKFDLSATNSGERSFIQNGRNIIAIPTGAYASSYSNCVIAGTNISGLSGGITKFDGCDFGGSLYYDNTLAYCNFVNCTLKAGGEIVSCPTAGVNFDNCEFGVPGGSTTLTIDAGVTGITIMGGRTNIAISDSGTGTQIMPTPQLF